MKISIVILTLCFFSCVDEKAETKIHSDNTNVRDSSISQVLKKFGVFLDEDQKKDSSLTFYCTSTFDTSFLLHVTPQFDGFYGVYSEILPTYHNSVNDFEIEQNQLLFFEGYSFFIDSTIWTKLKNMTQSKLSKDTSFLSNEGVRDGEQYVLAFGNDNSRSNQKNNSEYEDFYKEVKRQLLDSFLQKRKPNSYK